MAYMQTKALTHASRVRRLYKQAIRSLEAQYCVKPLEFRYHAVVMRARFDSHKDEVDMRKAKKLLLDGENECFEKSLAQPMQFPFSPGGVAYNRVAHVPDMILDSWHPLEKAQYPEYFARREVRKREFIERWEKKYGKSTNVDA
ncbi:hypothetical protein SNE40_012845 [Patella caerulea]|uniref:NADH dehydrogenase [ubiquinone] 1 beta subcomplex subunit 9 n=1 Tax=Patella caerulea TaxID=87958 RepID=A0AAN8JQB6_PATCE